MSIKENIIEDIEKVENKMKELEQKELEKESAAMELIHDANKTNKRLFIVILVILILWFSTICAFLYYINTTGYVETDEYSQEIKDIDSVNNSKIIKD